MNKKNLPVGIGKLQHVTENPKGCYEIKIDYFSEKFEYIRIENGVLSIKEPNKQFARTVKVADVVKINYVAEVNEHKAQQGIGDDGVYELSLIVKPPKYANFLPKSLLNNKLIPDSLRLFSQKFHIVSATHYYFISKLVTILETLFDLPRGTDITETGGNDSQTEKKKAVAEKSNDAEILEQEDWEYSFYRKNGRYILSVTIHKSFSFNVLHTLTEDEVLSYKKQGKQALQDRIKHMQDNFSEYKLGASR